MMHLMQSVKLWNNPHKMNLSNHLLPPIEDIGETEKNEIIMYVDKIITQPITKACLFSKQCLFKGVTVLVHAYFRAMLILRKVLIIARVRYIPINHRI